MLHQSRGSHKAVGSQATLLCAWSAISDVPCWDLPQRESPDNSQCSRGLPACCVIFSWCVCDWTTGLRDGSNVTLRNIYIYMTPPPASFLFIGPLSIKTCVCVCLTLTVPKCDASQKLMIESNYFCTIINPKLFNPSSFAHWVRHPMIAFLPWSFMFYFSDSTVLICMVNFSNWL